MAGCVALLVLVCGSIAASSPVFWSSSSTSSPRAGGIIRNMERSRQTGKPLDEMALKRNYQPKRNNDGLLVPTEVSHDVTLNVLLPTYYCWFSYFSRCPRTVTSSRRRSLAKESLDARSVQEIVKQAVLQALGGRYMAGYKHPKYKKTTTNLKNGKV